MQHIGETLGHIGRKGFPAKLLQGIAVNSFQKSCHVEPKKLHMSQAMAIKNVFFEASQCPNNTVVDCMNPIRAPLAGF